MLERGVLGVAGHEDDLRTRVLAEDAPAQRATVEARHHEVGEQQIDRADAVSSSSAAAPFGASSSV